MHDATWDQPLGSIHDMWVMPANLGTYMFSARIESKQGPPLPPAPPPPELCTECKRLTGTGSRMSRARPYGRP